MLKRLDPSLSFAFLFLSDVSSQCLLGDALVLLRCHHQRVQRGCSFWWKVFLGNSELVNCQYSSPVGNTVFSMMRRSDIFALAMSSSASAGAVTSRIWKFFLGWNIAIMALYASLISFSIKLGLVKCSLRNGGIIFNFRIFVFETFCGRGPCSLCAYEMSLFVGSCHADPSVLRSSLDELAKMLLGPWLFWASLEFLAILIASPIVGKSSWGGPCLF